MMAEPHVTHGHCLCNAITFTITGDPIYNVICHCTNCRRQGGSAFHCASIFLLSQHTLHGDSDKHITIYTDTVTNSTKPLYRAFCSICGSKIYAKTPLNNEIISVPLGAMDCAHGEGEEWKAGKEQYLDLKLSWIPEFGGIEHRSARALGGAVGSGGKAKEGAERL